MGNEAGPFGAGVTEEMVLDAIARSGYPLQAKAVQVALSALPSEELGGTRTFEEWSFLDRDSGTVRQLDALIQHSIQIVEELDRGDPGIPTDPRALLRYELNLLMECKQAELPLVFFTRPALHPPQLPIFIGLPHREISFGGFDEEPFVEMRLEDAVTDDALPGPSPEPAISVSRCFRKGRALELSGEDVFRSLTAPIRKAIDHYGGLSSIGPERRLYHDVRMVFPVVVIDAPMLACQVDSGVVAIRHISAARLSLSEPSASKWHFEGFNERSSLDFVHIDYLAEYCALARERAVDLAGRLGAAALQVLTGRAFFDFDAATDQEAGDGDGGHEQYALATLMPTMKADEAARWIAERFYEVHQAEPEDDLRS